MEGVSGRARVKASADAGFRARCPASDASGGPTQPSRHLPAKASLAEDVPCGVDRLNAKGLGELREFLAVVLCHGDLRGNGFGTGGDDRTVRRPCNQHGAAGGSLVAVSCSRVFSGWL